MAEFPDKEFAEFVRSVQEMALEAYPNPDRNGCPRKNVIREIAGLPLPSQHPVFEQHISRCSPCIADVLAERTRIQSGRRASVLRGTAAIAACLVLALIGFRVWQVHGRGATPVLVTINLRNHGTFRGGSIDQDLVATLPRRMVRTTIILPEDSRAGPYQIAVVKHRASNEAVALGKAEATANGTVATLVVPLDLTRVNQGTYWLATKRASDAPYYYAIRVK